jgi:hypothetical protein
MQNKDPATSMAAMQQAVLQGFCASEAAQEVLDLPATPFRSAHSPCAPPSQSAPAACGCGHSTPCRASRAASGGRCRGGLPVTNAAGTVTTIAACGLMGLHGLTGQCHAASQGRCGQHFVSCLAPGQKHAAPWWSLETGTHWTWTSYAKHSYSCKLLGMVRARWVRDNRVTQRMVLGVLPHPPSGNTSTDGARLSAMHLSIQLLKPCNAEAAGPGAGVLETHAAVG